MAPSNTPLKAFTVALAKCFHDHTRQLDCFPSSGIARTGLLPALSLAFSFSSLESFFLFVSSSLSLPSLVHITPFPKLLCLQVAGVSSLGQPHRCTRVTTAGFFWRSFTRNGENFVSVCWVHSES
jgi:hypothetical protein